MPKVVNVKREVCDIYIKRPSKWDNQYIIGKHGNRQEVIDKYEKYLIKNKALMDSLFGLKNKS